MWSIPVFQIRSSQSVNKLHLTLFPEVQQEIKCYFWILADILSDIGSILIK